MNFLRRLISSRLPSTRRRQEEQDKSLAEARKTSRREVQADRVIKTSTELATRLSAHREENHFAQRMRAAYRGEDTK